MALESATTINQLNAANPAPTDLLAQGDDHIRLIKSVLLATFPNITGPVTVSQATLNGVAAAIAAAANNTPVGIIATWYGSAASIPVGWHVCDGTVGVALSDGSGTINVPDLRDHVIIGAGALAAQGATYGSPTATADTSAAGGHSHATNAGEGGHAHSGVTVAGHALAISEIPSHTHSVACGTSEGDNSTNFTNGGNSIGPTVTSGATGGGAAHTHDMSWPTTPDGVHTHTTDATAAHTHGVTVSTYQPALGLHYIMKV